MLRLDKLLADMNVGTRSEVKQYIKKGRINVNGTSEKNPARKIDEQTAQISFDGKVLSYVKHMYYMFHKPSGCVTAVTDSRHKTVMDYFTGVNKKNLFPAGRLDLDTEGLLLITNDGVLAHDLLSPSKHVKKTYYAKVEGMVTNAHVEQFKEGLDIGEKRMTLPAHLEILSSDEQGNSEIKLTIEEGKFHQVKRMFAVCGFQVLYLKRVQMGALALDESLKPGEYRELTEEEYKLLTQNT